MNRRNNDGFYLALGMFLVVSICVIFAMCGKEIIREVDMFDKIIGYILKGFGLLIATTLLVWGCKLYICDFGIIDEWTHASSIDEKKSKKYTAIIFDESAPNGKFYKNVENAVFYSKEKEIKSKAFANCKKLKQIIFYEKPEIDKDAFIGCSNLSRITIYGKKEDWDNHQIFNPSNPKIEFISTESSSNNTVEKMKVDLNCNGTINIKHR